MKLYKIAKIALGGAVTCSLAFASIPAIAAPTDLTSSTAPQESIDQLFTTDASEVSSQLLDVAPESSLIATDELEVVELVSDSFLSAGQVDLPVDGDGMIETAATGLLIGLPREAETEKAEVSPEGVVVYAAQNEDSAAVAIAVTEEKTAVHTVIPHANASKEYTYPLDGGLPTLRADGGVDVKQTGLTIDAQGKEQIVSVDTVSVDAPWAVDANGNAVSTHYEIRGTSIVQVVDFDENTAFPVTADPTFWQVAECTGAVLWMLGSAIFSVGKIFKIKSLISKAGGVKKAMTKLIGAHQKWKRNGKKGSFTRSKELKALGETLMALGADIIGVTSIKNACFK